MGWVVFILSLCVAGFQVFYYYGQLPDTMAIHFGTGGAPNDWMSRDGFVIFYFGFLIFILAVFIGGGSLLKKLNPRLINMPYKDYWLAPERREDSLRYLQKWMINLGAVTAALIIGMHQMLIEINTAGTPPVLNEKAFLWALGGYAAIIAVFTIVFYRRFHKPGKG